MFEGKLRAIHSPYQRAERHGLAGLVSCRLVAEEHTRKEERGLGPLLCFGGRTPMNNRRANAWLQPSRALHGNVPEWSQHSGDPALDWIHIGNYYSGFILSLQMETVQLDGSSGLLNHAHVI